MTEDEIRKILHEMRDEPVPVDSLVRVRAAVAQGQSVKARLPWFAAIAVAAALAALVVMFRAEPLHQPAAPATRPVMSEAKPPLPAATVAPEVRRVAVARKPKARPIAKPEGEHLVVRIETEDPDVLILLIGD
jgi:hypothetical protein